MRRGLFFASKCKLRKQERFNDCVGYSIKFEVVYRRRPWMGAFRVEDPWKQVLGLKMSKKESTLANPSVRGSSRRGVGPGLGLASAFLVMLCSPGCGVLFGTRGGPGENLDLTQLKREGYSVGPRGIMQPLQADEASVVLEVNDGKRHFEKIPMRDGKPMFIADVIRDAQLTKKVGRIRVSVLRPNAGNAPVRMDIDFDDSGKRVREETNYSLRPGDHIVVSRDDTSSLSRMMSKGTLSGLIR